MGVGELATFLLLMGGFIVGVYYAIRWTNRRFRSDKQDSGALAAMEQRLAELEERLDFAERALTSQRARDQLPEPRRDG
jgi:hypothetical protein